MVSVFDPVGLSACFLCRQVKKTLSCPTQISAPKTVEWLGRYAQFRDIGPFARGEGGGCMGKTIYIYIYICTVYDRNFCDFPAKNTVYTAYIYGFLASPKHMLRAVRLSVTNFHTVDERNES
jgi:hypothetical protein